MPVESPSPLPPVSPGKDLRRGQKYAVKLILKQDKLVLQQPTGYGKTLTAAACYAALCPAGAGLVDHILHISTKVQQREQGAEDIPVDLQDWFNIPIKSWTIGDNELANFNAYPSHQLFSIGIQQLIQRRGMACVQDLLRRGGNWLIVVDEHHHYADDDDSTWTQAVLALPYRKMLVMSATPYGSDGKFSKFGKPDLVVSYWDGVAEEANKPLELHAYDYRTEFVGVNGKLQNFTTGELWKLSGGSVDQWTAAHQMRWRSEYISPLVLIPAERLNDHRIAGLRTQMLVFCMSVDHAKVTCKQVESLLPGLSVDWCGTGPDGRSDHENLAVLRRFCPPKNPLTNRREWSLDVLVTCSMGTEGMDCIDVSEVVFLNAPQINNTTLQAIGRGARAIPSLKVQPRCFVNVDRSSPLHQFAGSDVMNLFSEVPELPKPQDKTPEESLDDLPPYEPMPEFSLEVKRVELIDIMTHPAARYAYEHMRAKAPDKTDDQLREMIKEQFEEWWQKRSEPFNDAAFIGGKRTEIDARAHKLAGLCARIYVNSHPDARRQYGRLVAAFCVQINRRKARLFGSVQTIATRDAILKHGRFISDLEQELLDTRILPEWLHP